KNQGTLLLLLYGLLVIPYELWRDKSDNFPFYTRKYFLGLDEKVNTREFLNYFRNSLAHANFSLDLERSEFRFWNRNFSNLLNFDVKINYCNLGDFVTEIGLYYINLLPSLES